MNITIVRKYKTGDGKEFDSEADAKKHIVEHEALEKLRALFSVAINSSLTRQGNVDNVLRNLIGEASEVSKILATYRKKLPKTQPKSRKAAA